MARVAFRLPLLGARQRSPLDDIPGSNSLAGLAHLVRDARRFLHETARSAVGAGGAPVHHPEGSRVVLTAL